MKKIGRSIALVLTFLLLLVTAKRIGGIEWPVALVLLTGGALAAGFAGSVANRDGANSGMGGGIALVFRILIGAFAIACIAAGGFWLVARMA